MGAAAITYAYILQSIHSVFRQEENIDSFHASGLISPMKMVGAIMQGNGRIPADPFAARSSIELAAEIRELANVGSPAVRAALQELAFFYTARAAGLDELSEQHRASAPVQPSEG